MTPKTLKSDASTNPGERVLPGSLFLISLNQLQKCHNYRLVGQMTTTQVRKHYQNYLLNFAQIH